MIQTDDVRSIERALREVPDRFRELLVLRELEGQSYRELADAMGVPIGSVMSGLSRARQALRKALNNQLRPEGVMENTRPVSTRNTRVPQGPEDPNEESAVEASANPAAQPGRSTRTTSRRSETSDHRPAAGAGGAAPRLPR